eukprot:m.189134 g.189134  ORF g.189134 m.189134 type:complete len:61 (-) comp15101_c0_seq1:4507-4689(-)
MAHLANDEIVSKFWKRNSLQWSGCTEWCWPTSSAASIALLNRFSKIATNPGQPRDLNEGN